MADLSKYSSVSEYAKQDRSEGNELLYAVKHAHLLSGQVRPSEAVMAGTTSGPQVDKLAVMAAKSENTMYGTKVRATWSADDITREVTAKYDKSAIPLAALYTGATARKSERSVEGVFKRINDAVYGPMQSLIISNDATGWSDSGDRGAWGKHHDYLYQTTTGRKDISLVNIWRGIHAVIAKRGHVKNKVVNTGLFQGWTPTMDTLMNVRLSLYCVRLAKRQGSYKRGRPCWNRWLDWQCCASPHTPQGHQQGLCSISRGRTLRNHNGVLEESRTCIGWSQDHLQYMQIRILEPLLLPSLMDLLSKCEQSANYWWSTGEQVSSRLVFTVSSQAVGLAMSSSPTVRPLDLEKLSLRRVFAVRTW